MESGRVSLLALLTAHARSQSVEERSALRARMALALDHGRGTAVTRRLARRVLAQHEVRDVSRRP